jgi:uncharacterized protein YjbI with pentapeptide repeats
VIRSPNGATGRVRSLVALAIVAAFSSTAFGQVYQWEFIDPANPDRGKKQSTTLATDGGGANFDNVLGLSGRDLTKAYLFRRSIPQFRVQTTILDDAYLAEANLSSLQGGNLVARGADFSRANLEFARLVQSDLTGALLDGANLKRASLSGANLTGANLSGANIVEAQFSGTTSKGFTSQQLYQTASYQQGILDRVVLSANNLSGWNFTGQRLDGAEFSDSTLTGASFLNAVIPNAVFSGSNLAPEQLYETKSYQDKQLDGVRLEGMNIEGWDFSDQSLLLSRITPTQMSGAIFDRAKLSRVSIGAGQFSLQSDVSFRGADLTGSRFDTNARWERADFTGANLEDAQLSFNGFVNSNFTDVILRGAELRSTFTAGFTLADLYSTASYKTGDLKGVEIEYGDLRAANFAGIDFTGSRLANLQLDGANFRGANLTGVTLGATLEGADFLGANLTNANLYYERTTSISFRGANLTGAGFERTSLIGADFTDAIVFGTRLSVENSPKDLTAAQLYSTASYKAALLGPITLAGDMQGWNFEGQDLRGARFDRNGKLTGAAWSGAKLQNTVFFVNTLPGTNFRETDVRQVQFIASTLDGSDFRQTDLSEAYFSEASLVGVRFDGARANAARFVHANLQGASFVDAGIREADFVSISSFVDADFSGADIRGAELTYATNAGFTVEQLRATRSFQQRDLSGVDFEGNHFAGIDLSNFRLAGGDFNRANLTGANLSGADATGVSFQYANLSGLDLTDAIVKRANFSNSDNYGFIRAMLESTASYKNRVLTGVNLSQQDLQNWDFRSQDLRGASFQNSDLRGAALELSDLRGSLLPTNLTGIELGRSILSDGALQTLQIMDGETLTIRAAPVLTPITPTGGGRPPITPPVIPLGVKVTSSVAGVQGVLELLLDGNDWTSTIKFNALGQVTLAGELKLSFEEFALPAAAVGKSFDLFDWPLLGPMGEFNITTDPSQVWDLSSLYTTGEVRLVAVLPEPSSSLMIASLLTFAAVLRGRRRNHCWLAHWLRRQSADDSVALGMSRCRARC